MSVLTQRLLTEIESAPEPLQAEVLDFVLFVKARHSGGLIERTAGVCGGEDIDHFVLPAWDLQLISRGDEYHRFPC